jgi:hypothetical protein
LTPRSGNPAAVAGCPIKVAIAAAAMAEIRRFTPTSQIIDFYCILDFMLTLLRRVVKSRDISRHH